MRKFCVRASVDFAERFRFRTRGVGVIASGFCRENVHGNLCLCEFLRGDVAENDDMAAGKIVRRVQFTTTFAPLARSTSARRRW